VKPALFTPAAEADIKEAFDWYEAQRQGLGAAFRHALDIAVAALESNTEAYPVVHRDTRRVLLPRFPYGLYYRVVGEEVVVVGCIHAKRNPRIWRHRGAG
jgi:plasmid stabilization system protein ParE